MATRDIAVSDAQQPLGPLAERGWSVHNNEGADADATVHELGRLGDRLGTRVVGRAGEFVGKEFRCPTCDLTLIGNDEIDASGLNYIHEDQQEREMEYEPDFRND